MRFWNRTYVIKDISKLQLLKCVLLYLSQCNLAEGWISSSCTVIVQCLHCPLQPHTHTHTCTVCFLWPPLHCRHIKEWFVFRNLGEEAAVWNREGDRWRGLRVCECVCGSYSHWGRRWGHSRSHPPTDPRFKAEVCCFCAARASKNRISKIMTVFKPVSWTHSHLPNTALVSRRDSFQNLSQPCTFKQ